MQLYLNKISYITAIFSIVFLFQTFAACADYKKIGPTDKEHIKEIESAKIYYSSDITEKKISDLIAAIDDININFKNAKRIYLYINSYGGDMDSGYMAYWAVKSSQIPITAINLSTVASSATMMFCGAEERRSRKGGRFILHPARLEHKRSSFQPDDLAEAQQDLSGYNRMFVDVYKECTNFSDEKLKSILHSENQREFLLLEEARDRGLITGIADKIVDASVAYYITDAQKDDE